VLLLVFDILHEVILLEVIRKRRHGNPHIGADAALRACAY